MTRTIAIVLFLLNSVLLSAQDNVSGFVFYEADREPAAGVNVILRRVADESVVSFALTDSEGRFSIKCDEKDGLSLLITGIDVEMTEYPISSTRQDLRIAIKSAPLNIQEARVKAPPFTMKSDTLNFTVAQYKVESDRTIADVLKKMPGIDVSKSGKVTYNGKEINRFYIEGMDMLGSGYGVASNNLRADDIASVDVYTRHQPVRALEDIESTDQAALNLKLKENSRGAMLGSAQLGAGYSPLMGDAELLGMYFGKSTQALASVKANNEGNDIVAQEIDPLNLASAPTTAHLLSASSPFQPPVDRSRYLDNNIIASSANLLKKISDESEVVVKANYIHDLRKANGRTDRVYTFGDGSGLQFFEDISNREKSDKLGITSTYRKNSAKHFVNESLEINASVVSTEASVEGQGNTYGQTLDSPDLRISNTFSDLFRVGKRIFSLSSKTDYVRSSSELAVSNSPFAKTSVGDLVVQSLNFSDFRTSNSIRYQYNNGLLQLGMRAGFDYTDSKLSGDTREGTQALGSQEGHISVLDLVLTPSFGYDLGRKFKATLSMPVVLRNNRTMNGTDRYAFVRPSILITADLSRRLSFTLNSNMSQSDGGIHDLYSGAIMTSYRQMSASSGVLPHTNTMNVSPSLEYRNPVSGVIANLSVVYSRSQSSHITSSDISEDSTQKEIISQKNLSDRKSLNIRIAKRMDALATTFHVNGGWSSMGSSMMLQGVMSVLDNESWTGRVSAETRFSSKLNAELSTSINSSSMFMDGQKRSQRGYSESFLSVNFLPVKNHVITALVENYLIKPSGLPVTSVNFVDLSYRITAGRMTFSVDARNLLNTREFLSVSVGDAVTTTSTMKMRPASVVFRVKRDI